MENYRAVLNDILGELRAIRKACEWQNRDTLDRRATDEENEQHSTEAIQALQDEMIAKQRALYEEQAAKNRAAQYEINEQWYKAHIAQYHGGVIPDTDKRKEVAN